MHSLASFLAGLLLTISVKSPLHLVSPVGSAASTVATSSISPEPPPLPIESVHITSGTIRRILQPNSVEVFIEGSPEVVALVGLAEPEAHTLSTACPYDMLDASRRTVLLGKKVYLIDDSEINDRDSYTRLNRYLLFPDSTLVNLTLIEKGLALHTKNDVSLYRDEFSDAQRRAKENSLGLWSHACVPSATPTLSLTPSSSPIPSSSPTSSVRIVSRPQSPTMTPLPTLRPTHTPIPTRLPTSIPSPYIPIPNAEVSHTPQSLDSDILFTLINMYRKQKGLSPYAKDAQLCALAQSRSVELSHEVEGHSQLHSGLYARNIPYWITENIAHYEDEATIMNFWLHSPLHQAAIEGTFLYSCGACEGSSCTQLFTSYVKK